MFRHIHILGAPGSGVTTLGKTLAARLGFSHFDTDDYYWFTEDALPYRRKRNAEHRCRVLRQDLPRAEQWVLSGALCGWGDVFIPEFDFVIYLWQPFEIRSEQIRSREIRRYGAERLEPGGDLHNVYEKFMDWAAVYDRESENIRSRARELQWLLQLSCPVLKVEGHEMSPEELTEYVLKEITG